MDMEPLPLEAQSNAALWDARQGILRAIQGGRVAGHDLLTALDWLDVLEAELRARGYKKFKTWWAVAVSLTDKV